MLTVIVPAYNEADTIDEILRRVEAAPIEKEIIVVDDASTDGTGEILKRWSERVGVTVITHERNRGKGAAIRTALAYASGYHTIIQDADLEYEPGDYARLLETLVAGEADAVYGSRYLSDQRRTMSRYGVSVINRALKWLYGVCLSDEATCYKLFRTDDLRAMNLECEGFEFCPEVTAKSCRMGLRIVEVPISYAPRTVAEGKKIRWRDGWTALATLWRWRKWGANAGAARRRGVA